MKTINATAYQHPQGRFLLQMKAQGEGWHLPRMVASNALLAQRTKDGLTIDEATRAAANAALAARNVTGHPRDVQRAITVSIRAHQQFHGLQA